MKGIKKYIDLADIHFPLNIKLDSIFKFIHQFKPHIVNILGDFWDLDIISKYSDALLKFKGFNYVRDKLLEEAEDLGRILELFNPENMPFIEERNFLKGNHEVRIEAFKIRYPQFTSKFTLDEFLFLNDRGWNVIEQGKYVKTGKLYHLHGDNLGTQNYAKQGAINCHKNMVVAHHHSNQSYMTYSPLDSKEIIQVQAIGCLCDKNPDYLRNKPNRWINSFASGYIFPNGNYQNHVTNIFDGIFIAPNGRVYT